MKERNSAGLVTAGSQTSYRHSPAENFWQAKTSENSIAPEEVRAWPNLYSDIQIRRFCCFVCCPGRIGSIDHQPTGLQVDNQPATMPQKGLDRSS
ncbi:General alpha-glucoside permease [Fusarium oxysporum f. sp. albedinis]|nr:General alpha-glucoside permease [Fusarium oxysporum f. sp. albedinis]